MDEVDVLLQRSRQNIGERSNDFTSTLCVGKHAEISTEQLVRLADRDCEADPVSCSRSTGREAILLQPRIDSIGSVGLGSNILRDLDEDVSAHEVADPRIQRTHLFLGQPLSISWTLRIAYAIQRIDEAIGVALSESEAKRQCLLWGSWADIDETSRGRAPRWLGIEVPAKMGCRTCAAEYHHQARCEGETQNKHSEIAWVC